MARKADYGLGSNGFREYQGTTVAHPIYQGMPDVYKKDGTIQWEAPSNRTSGEHKDTHHRRREWWQKKALSVGIDPLSANWISRTAKTIHPTKEKPCKKCGRMMAIPYAYPTKRLLNKIAELEYFDGEFTLDPLEHITGLIPRFAERYGDQVFRDLPLLLRTSAIITPDIAPNLGAWLHWIVNEYIPAEPSLLSPGAMSNAPDRLDGFHSFNLCCRGSADTGRSQANLRSYTTDRRAIEYWSDGDWNASDRLMGLVRTAPAFVDARCANDPTHPGICYADHIGPISLGFAHRPEFRLLCKSCNSGKNNRMTLGDVAHLREAEAAGEVVTSWYIRTLWDARKNHVADNETAQRLSKMLRDNRHNIMYLLNRIAQEGYYTFLSSLLGLGYAGFNVRFTNIRSENNITRYSNIKHTRKTTVYAAEQKARRLRVGFAALQDYSAKESRNALLVNHAEVEEQIRSALSVLATVDDDVNELDRRVAAFFAPGGIPSDMGMRRIAEEMTSLDPIRPQFAEAKAALVRAMDVVAEHISSRWEDERYVRSHSFEQGDDALLGYGGGSNA